VKRKGKENPGVAGGEEGRGRGDGKMRKGRLRRDPGPKDFYLG